MSVQAVIAVRGGANAKSRCAQRLEPARRERLVEAMLGDMLDALRLCPSVGRVHVVTPTPQIAAFAVAAGAAVVRERGPSDLNSAFAAARRRIAAEAPDDIVALLPGDLPLLQPGELEAMLRLAHEPGRVALAAASADGGTGAVVHRAGLEFPLAFGPASFARHCASAETLGLDLRVVDAPSLAFDVDRPEDLDRVVAEAPESRTAALLRAPAASPEAAA